MSNLSTDLQQVEQIIPALVDTYVAQNIGVDQETTVTNVMTKLQAWVSENVKGFWVFVIDLILPTTAPHYIRAAYQQITGTGSGDLPVAGTASVTEPGAVAPTMNATVQVGTPAVTTMP